MGDGRRKLITLPQTVERCHTRIRELEKELQTISDAYHTVANDAARLLSQKDLDMITKCKCCQRGIK